MKLQPFLDLPIYAYSRARSAQFMAEYLALQATSLLFPSSALHRQKKDFKTLNAIRKDILRFLREDAGHIRSGLYPLAVLTPESPLSHLLRIPRIYWDAFGIHRRRVSGRTTEFDDQAKEFLEDVPLYYRRNFHFQTSGYLSPLSAEIYEHQVEMLFQGTADAMRRLIIAPLRKHFGSTDGKGLRFLEVGAGTGRATRFVHLAFPKAKIVATDLSDPYLKVAQHRLSKLNRIDFLQADGANLPFKNAEFDAAYSVFLFHELPMSAREAILTESRRILKPGGFLGMVDSIQIGDRPEYDELLTNFPKEFHEPFYRDYISHPMEKVLHSQGFISGGSSTGFYSKVCWGRRPRLVMKTSRPRKLN